MYDVINTTDELGYNPPFVLTARFHTLENAIIDFTTKMIANLKKPFHIQLVPVATKLEPSPQPIMVFNNQGVDVQVINTNDDRYAWMDPETETTWVRPTAHAYAMTCKALHKHRERSESTGPNSSFALGVEFGYRECEKGSNLQMALKNANGG